MKARWINPWKRVKALQRSNEELRATVAGLMGALEAYRDRKAAARDGLLAAYAVGADFRFRGTLLGNASEHRIAAWLMGAGAWLRRGLGKDMDDLLTPEQWAEIETPASVVVRTKVYTLEELRDRQLAEVDHRLQRILSLVLSQFRRPDPEP